MTFVEEQFGDKEEGYKMNVDDEQLNFGECDETKKCIKQKAPPRVRNQLMSHLIRAQERNIFKVNENGIQEMIVDPKLGHELYISIHEEALKELKEQPEEAKTKEQRDFQKGLEEDLQNEYAIKEARNKPLTTSKIEELFKVINISETIEELLVSEPISHGFVEPDTTLTSLDSQSQEQASLRHSYIQEQKSEKVRKRKRNPSNWKRNIRKQSKEAGKGYISVTGKVVGSKTLKPPCNCRKKCFEKLNDEQRESLFKTFYSLDGKEQNHFIASHLKEHDKQAQRLRGENSSYRRSRRQYTRKYFLHIEEGMLLEVCQTMFLNTLDITLGKVRVIVEKKRLNEIKISQNDEMENDSENDTDNDRENTILNTKDRSELYLSSVSTSDTEKDRNSTVNGQTDRVFSSDMVQAAPDEELGPGSEHQLAKRHSTVEVDMEEIIKRTKRFSIETRPVSCFEEPPILKISPSSQLPVRIRQRFETSTEDVSTQDSNTVTPRKRKKDPLNRIGNVRKRFKEEEIISVTGKREASKTLKPPCDCKKKCFEKINNDQRNILFETLYGLSGKAQNEFIASHLKVYHNQAQRGSAGAKKRSRRERQFTRKYFLHSEDGVLSEVCQTMFLNTFDLSLGQVKKIAKKKRQHENRISQRKDNEDGNTSEDRNWSPSSHEDLDSVDVTAMKTEMDFDCAVEVQVEEGQTYEVLQTELGKRKKENKLKTNSEHQWPPTDPFIKTWIEVFNKVANSSGIKGESSISETVSERFVEPATVQIFSDTSSQGQGHQGSQLQEQDHQSSSTASREENFENHQKRKRNPSNWKRNIRKQSKEAGKDYISVTGKHIPSKMLKPPCNCRKKCFMKMGDEHREKMFKSFYSLGGKAQNQFIALHMREHDKQVQRVRGQDGNEKASRRNFTRRYFLHSEDFIWFEVCQTMFLNTLDLTLGKVRIIAEKKRQNEDGLYEEDRRGKHKKKKTPEEDLIIIEEHIKMFPADMKYPDLPFTTMYSLFIDFWVHEYKKNPNKIPKEHTYRRVIHEKFDFPS